MKITIDPFIFPERRIQVYGLGLGDKDIVMGNPLNFPALGAKEKR